MESEPGYEFWRFEIEEVEQGGELEEIVGVYIAVAFQPEGEITAHNTCATAAAPERGARYRLAVPTEPEHFPGVIDLCGGDIERVSGEPAATGRSFEDIDPVSRSGRSAGHDNDLALTLLAATALTAVGAVGAAWIARAR